MLSQHLVLVAIVIEIFNCGPTIDNLIYHNDTTQLQMYTKLDILNLTQYRAPKFCFSVYSLVVGLIDQSIFL